MILRFVVFFAVFFSIYGGMHLYLFVRLRNAFGLHGAALAGLGVFCGIMTLSPVVIRMLERLPVRPFTHAFALVAYTWMGIGFLLFMFLVTADAYFGITRLLPVLPVPSRLFIVRTGLLLCGGILIWGLWENRAPRVEQVTVRTSKDIGRDSITVAHVSDVHLSILTGRSTVVKILGLIAPYRPDVFVSNGDLVDQDMKSCGHVADLFRDFKAPLGKFATTGNHEMIAGLSQASAFIDSAGFTLLRGRAVRITDGFVIAGVDDPAGRQMGALDARPPDGAVLDTLDASAYRLFLRHSPTIETEASGKFDLMLSGHTHKGQIFPFTLFVRLAFKYVAGMYGLPDGTHVYVGRGTGTWGPPFRFLAPPEITIFTFVRESAS